MMSLFSSPPRGIYISTYIAESRCRYEKSSSRPLHGESIYLQQKLTSSSLHALCRSRPLHGESIYLPILKKFGYNKRIVLVPSTGNLYIYMEEAIDDCEEVSSRPLHGESIYLLTMFNTMRAVKQCSRPLHGESIYLQIPVSSFMH